MKVLITPRGFANYGTDIVKEMEAKGVTVHYNDTGKQYTPEQFLELAKDADGIIVGVDVMDKGRKQLCSSIRSQKQKFPPIWKRANRSTKPEHTAFREKARC